MTLQDSFGRRFRYLRLSVTDVCNFRCNYCLPDGYQCTTEEQPLSVNEIQQLAQAFARAGTRKIRITGGEPSVRADLPEIIRTLRAVPGIEEVALTTNGYRLGERVHEWKAAGLDRFNLSIDSLDPGVFAAITGSLSARFTSEKGTEQVYNTKMDEVRNYLNDNGIPIVQRKAVEAHYRRHWQNKSIYVRQPISAPAGSR